ncbi:WD40 repeat domain-containing protein [Halarcobacter sp.]|uniref:WD40 repeat domain-containing protein n=1 Tax=Halarcobacter sp. TaxID=2321133 RepID=UPI003A9132CF
MSKFFLSFFILVVSSFALEEVTPTYSLKATGAVQGIVYKDELLYTGTANGTVEVFDTKEKKIIKTIELPKIKDFMGDTIPAKVYSIDLIEDKILIVTQGMKGYRNLWIYENEELKKLIGIEKKFFIQKASFVSDTRVVFALLSNQLGIFDIEKNEVTVLTQVSQSSFSHFALNENRSKLITTDESGVIRVLKTSDLVVEKRLKALNLDRVYQLDFKKGKVLTAGQDRKAVFYDSFSSYALNFDFLLYSCALSKNAKYGAIAYNEENEILVFNTSSKKYLYKLIGQDATLTQILFISDKEIFASSDSQTINFWRLK